LFLPNVSIGLVQHFKARVELRLDRVGAEERSAKRVDGANAGGVHGAESAFPFGTVASIGIFGAVCNGLTDAGAHFACGFFGKGDGDEISTNESVRRGLGHDIYIIVSDIEGVFRELTEAGVEVDEGPIKRLYGSIEVVAKDCFGFKIVFGN